MLVSVGNTTDFGLWFKSWSGWMASPQNIGGMHQEEHPVSKQCQTHHASHLTEQSYFFFCFVFLISWKL